MNYLMKHFDRENQLLNGQFDDYRPALEILTDIFDKHGHSGSSASFVISHLKHYRELRYTEIGFEERSVFKVDVNFKDLFDQLDMWYFGNEYQKGVDVGINGIDPIQIEEDGAFIDFFTLLDTFILIANQDPISPLTGEDWEWMEVGSGMYQNKRLSSVFKDTLKDEVYWLDGNAVLEFSKDYSYQSGYSSSDIPRYQITFPFDIARHEKIYYVRRNGSRENLLIGPRSQIGDQIETIQREGRRNWMLGFEDDGVTLRKDILLPTNYMQMCAAVVHFNELIIPMLDSGECDLYNLNPTQRALFEGSVIHTLPLKITMVLYRAAVIYSELDREARQKIFGKEVRIESFYQPTQHYQGFKPYTEDDRSVNLSTIPDTDWAENLILLTSDRKILRDEQAARKYLFEQCKDKGLEFKPGKQGEIMKYHRMTGNTVFSGWFTPYLVEESTESQYRIKNHYEMARKYQEKQGY